MKKGLFFLSTAVLITCLIALLVGNPPARAADATWTARYWNNKSLSGKAVVTRQEGSLNHKWGTGRPASKINRNEFSARWTRTVNFSKSQYVFRTTSDDGIRVWVDNKKIIDQWNNHPLQTYFVIVNMTAGDHDLKVEYYENQGMANASLSWARLKSNPWTAQYFNGTNFSGSVIVNRKENSIENFWGRANPAPGVHGGNFSVRWTRTANFTKGTYKFKVRVGGGGFRVYLDGDLIMNHWDLNNDVFRVKKSLSNGSHKIRLDYFSNDTPAVIFFHIYKQ